MNRRFIALIFAALMSIPTGCGYSKRVDFYSGPSSSKLMMEAFAASPQRYVAERHKLEIIAPESDLQKSWESTVAYCGTLQCEVVSSGITTRVGDSMPSGVISLRVAPDDLKRLLGSVEKLGKIAQHTTEREDKTTAVVDTDAKIKNLTSFRDNLRAMLSKPAATVKDLVEIQKQLTDTQSELDSETAQRKILANETEKLPSKSPSVWKDPAEMREALPKYGMPCANQVPFWRIVLRLLSPQSSLSFRGLF